MLNLGVLGRPALAPAFASESGGLTGSNEKEGTRHMQDFIRTSLIGAAFAMALSASASAQTNWDMATPYGDNNFHTQNIAAFADEIREATNEIGRAHV